LLAAVEDEVGELSSAFESLPMSSVSRRCLLAGRPAGEEDAAGGFIGEEWEKTRYRIAIGLKYSILLWERKTLPSN
jgi:hypothetical protein